MLMNSLVIRAHFSAKTMRVPFTPTARLSVETMQLLILIR